MIEIDKNGFLGESINAWSLSFRKAHGSLLEQCEQLNRDVHSLLYSVKVHNKDPREIIVALLLTRATELYQSSILLLTKGMQTSAKVVIRGLLESVFSLRAVARHDEILKAYIECDETERLKMINKAKNNNSPNLELLKEAATNEFIASVRKTIDDKGIGRLSTEEFSKKAGMHDWYLTVYPMLSKTAHSTVRDLEDQLKINANKEIKGLKYGPVDSEARNLLANASHCLVLGLTATAIVFEYDLQKLCLEKHINFIKSVIDELNAQCPAKKR